MDYSNSIQEYAKSCKSYNHRTRSIHTSELYKFCSRFKLNYQDCCEYVGDSKSYVPVSNLVLFFSDHYGSNLHFADDASVEVDRTADLGTSSPEVFGHAEYHPTIDRRESPTAFSFNFHGQKQQSDSESDDLMFKVKCKSCHHLQRKCQGFLDHIRALSRERDKLQQYNDRLRNDIQHVSSCYQIALKDKDRYKQELRKLRSDNAENPTYIIDRHTDDMESLKHYKKLSLALKNDIEVLKQQMQDLNRDKWLLMDEKQHLEYKFLFDGTKLSKVSHPESKKYNIVSLTSNEADTDIPVREPGPSSKSVKSTPTDTSEAVGRLTLPCSQSHTFPVLNEDVNINVLPESITQELRLQIVYALQNCHSIQDIVQCLVSYGFSQSCSGHGHLIVENEHLQAQLKHLDAKNATLNGSFVKAKAETDTMYHKLAKVEANNCRLRNVVRLLQESIHFHELLYDIVVWDNKSSTNRPFSPDSELNSPIASLHSNTGSHLMYKAKFLIQSVHDNYELHSYIPSVQCDKKDQWNSSLSQYTTTSGLSSASSGTGDTEVSLTEVQKLKMYYQAMLKHSNHLIDTLEEIDGLSKILTVKEFHVVQDSLLSQEHDRTCDMEEYADNEELSKIREEKAELRSQMYMMEQSKRNMELQVSRMQLHIAMLERVQHELSETLKAEKKKRQRLKDKLKQSKSDDKSNDHKEMFDAIEKEKESQRRYKELFNFLQKHIYESQKRGEHLIEFVKELLRANRALVEAFERAKKRQQFEKKQMKQEIIQLVNKTHIT